MSKIDKIKEKINYLKVWLGIFIITNISLASWLINNYNKANEIIVYGDIAAILLLTVAVILIHRNICKKIDDLKTDAKEDRKTANTHYAEIMRAIHVDVTGLNGAAMRGTDSAALATVCTEARLAELDGANLPTDIANLNDISVADVLGGAITELAADPGASPTLKGALALLYMALRNKRDTIATADEIHNNAGGVILTAAISDDTVTFTKGKYA